MNRLVAIDPGARTGIAEFRDGILHAAGVSSFQALVTGRGIFEGRIVVEVPDRVEPGIPLADILLLARRAGGLGYRFSPGPEFVGASLWKGSVPKKIHNSRVLALLSDSERAILPSRDHNMIDAVGLGLWALGRMRRGR